MTSGDPVSQQESANRLVCLQLSMQYWRDQQSRDVYPDKADEVIVVSSQFYNYIYADNLVVTRSSEHIAQEGEPIQNH